GTVSLQASDDIGSADAHIELAGVTDLIVDVGEGNIFLSGSDGLGGAGAPLKSLTLRLEPDEAGQYVVGNFADQTLAFDQGAFGDDLVIREITSATRLDLTVATRDDEGIRVGGGAGIQLAGGNVRLDSAGAINEAVPDDTVQVSAEITTDGRVTLVAVNGIGTSGMLDVAAGPGGVSSLEAASAAGAVRINGLDALRIEGSGIDAPGGGALAAARGLVIAANVESASDMTFTAASDAASAGNDVSIEAGALVRLDSAQSATLRFDAGDHIEFDGGSVETNGSATHRVELNADLENGGSDGVIGRVAQTGDASSVLGAHLSVTAGGGVGAGTALRTQVTSLSLDNTSAGEVQVVNAGDLDVVGSLRNQAPGEALVLVSEGGSLRLDGVVETSDGALTLKAGNAIQQLAGRIASASLRSESAGDTTLASADNTIARLSSKAGGSVVVQNGARLAVDETDVTGDLQIDNAQGIDIAGTVVVGGRVRLTTAAGNIDGAGGHIQAATLELDSASGIGIGAALETDIGADVSILSRGSGADGDIRIEQRGSFDTQQLQRLATDAASTQTVSLRAQETLTVSRDPVGDPADLGPGDRLELDGARIELAANISARDVDLNFKAPVGVIGDSTINLDQGLLTFDENVSPASNTTLALQSEVVFASGHVTGEPGSSLNVQGTLNLAIDTTIEIDNLRLSGDPASLTGGGSLTLLPATHGKDIVLGGANGLVPDVTLETLEGFGGGRALNIGVPALPTTRSPFAGNVRVARGLSVGDAVLTVGGLGDVILGNQADPLASDRGINIVAIG
ncbi:MAG: hypothetical protein GWN21_11715, partial [Gammaproteobacteria bacterium]|nr:hypothetical protein [Gammaproteobacteria bacterium]NIP89091.1 hypothetical protein [Gammaproteobacteria bacterium]NIR23951.1 hypothetical protein [Gammaproteobacteria bacterium]NIS05585.1 hypothetical protein [Gammaproteobacteria bacterium]NIU40899.1 hypothetical protein [Gammaproteobacteria bacterium]